MRCSSVLKSRGVWSEGLGGCGSRFASVAVVGSCMIDMIAYTPRLPAVGETIHGTRFEQGFGGKGANQCIQAAKLGSSTAMVAKLGSDSYGVETVGNFKAHGVDTKFVFTTDEASSGLAPITVDDEGNNCIVIVAGANMLLSPEEVESARDVIEAAKVAVCQLEIPLESSMTALRIAKSAGALTILNPAPAIPDMDTSILEYTDVFCPNETEAALLSGVDTSTREGCEEASAVIRSMGCKQVLLTLGSEGCLLVDEGGSRHYPVASGISAVDSSGAGDSFIGALSAFLGAGLNVDEAIRRANIVAGHSVTSRGTQRSYGTMDDFNF